MMKYPLEDEMNYFLHAVYDETHSWPEAERKLRLVLSKLGVQDGKPSPGDLKRMAHERGSRLLLRVYCGFCSLPNGSPDRSTTGWLAFGRVKGDRADEWVTFDHQMGVGREKMDYPMLGLVLTCPRCNRNIEMNYYTLEKIGESHIGRLQQSTRISLYSIIQLGVKTGTADYEMLEGARCLSLLPKLQESIEDELASASYKIEDSELILGKLQKTLDERGKRASR